MQGAPERRARDEDLCIAQQKRRPLSVTLYSIPKSLIASFVLLAFPDRGVARRASEEAVAAIIGIWELSKVSPQSRASLIDKIRNVRYMFSSMESRAALR
jgi:hypothetical protein